MSDDLFAKLKMAIKEMFYRASELVLKPILHRMDQLLYRMDHQENILKLFSELNFRTRAIAKIAQNKPISVLFVCHEPALWSMFRTVYTSMKNDPMFLPLVVAMPYKHEKLHNREYKDAGMLEFCKQQNIEVINGYDKEKYTWLNPISLLPDYIFFQTPYSFFPEIWSVKQISKISKVCYIPYGTTLFRGAIENIVDPHSFFKYVSLIFNDNLISQKKFVNKFKDENWFCEKKIILSGHPKLDDNEQKTGYADIVWKRGINRNIKRILWTPRWNTEEGVCHFFDYEYFFSEFCKNHPDIDLVLRPHPLCFQNFISTGELTTKELNQIEQKYEKSINMKIDETYDYQDTFLTSDILVSDISTMMVEFFLTKKPIIYTNRINLFNELGQKLSEGFYWVNNSNELLKTLEMLIKGNDPLKDKRNEIIKTVLFRPKEGAGANIKEFIRSDFYEIAS